MKNYKAILNVMLSSPVILTAKEQTQWVIDTQEEWTQGISSKSEIEFKEGMASPTAKNSTITSKLQSYDELRSAQSITIAQSPVWLNWQPVARFGPANLGNAPVMITKGPGDYWMFGAYQEPKAKKNSKAKDKKPKAKTKEFIAEDATLKGYDVPLKTTPYKNQYDAPGGLKPSLGGYHAWQSKDMINWVHHGPVTEEPSKWVTTAEYVDGKTYIYYDFPNDQDPHLFIDEDLTDGIPGKNMGLAFEDPSDGSDCTFIRDLDGKFHVIYEDWSPINARKHSWDSPLAGHAISPDGKGDFKLLPPAVDVRTNPTGKFSHFTHPHWHAGNPEKYPAEENGKAISKYEIHDPEQNAFGDWASISIGGQYYLFGDYHPANKSIRTGWFTSSSIDKQFTYCGEIGEGHPDPDIAFAEGKFYLATQTKMDYISTGPWVETVEVRVGVDTDKDGKIDQWTDWSVVEESYDYIKGFSKQISREPALLDLSKLPKGYGFQFEVKMTDTTKNASKPILDKVELTFAK